MSAQRPTADDFAGMAWWNNLSEKERVLWCHVAHTACPRDAWTLYKALREVAESAV